VTLVSRACALSFAFCALTASESRLRWSVFCAMRVLRSFAMVASAVRLRYIRLV
jgi:hypothetical protein